MKTSLAFILILLLGFGCKIITKQATVTTNASDSTLVKVAVKDSVYEKHEVKAATNNNIAVVVDVNDSGDFNPATYITTSGGDSLVLELKGKLIKARSNCASSTQYYKYQLHLKDSLLSIKKDSATSAFFFKTVTETTNKIPFYIWLLIGVLVAVIGVLAFRLIWI